MKRLIVWAIIQWGCAGGAIAQERAEWPESLEVSCGEVSVRIIERAQWTMNVIRYRGEAMSTERSAYGTVFSFPGVGFIGTGHLENEPEDVRELEFYLDGKRVDGKGGELKGKTFRAERRSRIRAFDMHGTVELRDNRLIETVRVECREATPLKLVYHFMHAWNPSATEYLAGKDSGEETGGVFEPDLEAERSFVVNDEVDWVAVYGGAPGKFAVARLLEKPKAGGAMSKIWDVPGTYRKHYTQCFTNSVVLKGFEGTWKMVTAFGEASEGEWKEKARALAEELKAKAGVGGD